MKKTAFISIILTLILALFIPCCATAEDTSLILSASQELVDGEDRFGSIDSFIDPRMTRWKPF